MPSVIVVLIIAAALLTVAAAWKDSKLPLWAAVGLLCVIELLQALPR